MPMPQKRQRCQLHQLCEGWSKTTEQITAGLCKSCLDTELDDERRHALMQIRVSRALEHISELIEQASEDRQVKAIALSLVNQLMTLGHLSAKTASDYMRRIHSLAVDRDEIALSWPDECAMPHVSEG